MEGRRSCSRACCKALACFFVEGCLLCSLTASSATAQQSSESPSSSLPWVPTQGAPPGANYVGRQACAECHLSEAQTQAHSPMGQAAEAVADCETLIKHPVLTYRFGAYSYRIARDGDRSTY